MAPPWVFPNPCIVPGLRRSPGLPLPHAPAKLFEVAYRSAFRVQCLLLLQDLLGVG